MPEPRPEEVEVDLLVGADAALERDRDEIAGRLEDVDPGIVVVDDPAGLLDDGPPARVSPRGRAEAGGGGVEDSELAGEEGRDRLVAGRRRVHCGRGRRRLV